MKMPKAVSATKKASRSPTEFETRVYNLARKIPRGRVTSYGHLAAILHSSARAVGNALRHNPFAPEVPCHRIVRSSGHIGGFSGQTKGECIDRKVALLRQEGVVLAIRGSDLVVLPEHVITAAQLQQGAKNNKSID